MYGSFSEIQMRPILVLQKDVLRIIYSLHFHASCTHLFTESRIRTICAMYADALLEYLLFNFRKIVEKGMSLSHNMKTSRQQKSLLHYAKTSKLAGNSIQYKAVKLYNMFKEIGLWPPGIDQEQNKKLRRYYRDILIPYLKDNTDILAFFK